MTSLMLIAVLALVQPAVSVDPLTVCEHGWVCWTDRSDGTATTELRFRAQGGELITTVPASVTQWAFVDLLRASPILPSDWLCVQARQQAPDGTLSNWYISATEGVCNATAAILPPIPVPPPPVEPPAPWTTVTVEERSLKFSYRLTDCPKGIRKQNGKIINGSRTVTMRCRK